MKILNIRFANLNSLAGVWAIDLTGPEYAADGIFAITGPTGAGKSTILDAVCLALYGRTPRLKQLSKSTNEIMTRLTGECWSEVEFSTSKGRYRCHWSQHRARKTAGGDLQAPRHEIVDATTDRPLETKVKQVAQKVIDVTGMTYEQFTRSILLAQGDFNTFLKAPPDERAPILEQITGTDIYSRISKKVHERRAEELVQFELLSKECNGFTPLSEEQLADINSQLLEKGKETQTIQEHINHHRILIDWHLTQERLQREITGQKEKLADLEHKRLLQEPLRQQLAAAEKAQTLEPLHLRLIEAQALQDKEQDEQDKGAGLLSQKALELDETATKESLAREERAKLKQEFSALAVVLRQVRQLDQQLKMIGEQRAEITNQLAAELSRKKATEKLLENLINQNAALERQVSILEEYRTRHATDSTLVEDYSGLKEQVDQYLEAAIRHTGLADQLPPLYRQQKENHDLVEKKKTAVTELFKQQTLLETQEATSAIRLKKLLDGITLEQLYDRESQLQQQLNLLGQAETLVDQHSRMTGELNTLAGRKVATAEEQTQLSNHCRELVTLVQSQQQNVEKQQQIVRLAEKVKNYEEERKHLRDNHPCPLCGSLSHPYGERGSEPDEGDERECLSSETARLETLRDQLAAVRITLASQDKERELIDLNIAARTSEKNEIIEKITRIFNELGLQPDSRLDDQLAHLRPELLKQHTILATLRKEVQHLKNQLDDLARDKNNLARECNNAERELQQLRHQREKIDTLLQQHSSELALSQRLLAEKRTALASRLEPFIASPVTVDNCGDILRELAERRAAWLDSEKRHQHQTKLLQEGRGKQSSQQLLLANQQAACAEKERQHAQLAADHNTLWQQRLLLFGEDSADEAEKQMQTRLETTEQLAASLASLLGNLREEHAALTAGQTARGKRLAERTELLRSLNRKFTDSLLAAGFADQAMFLASRLTDEQYENLQLTIETVRKTREETQALLQAATQALQIEQNRNFTDIPREDLEAGLAELQGNHSAIQRQIGALHQQLEDNRQQQQRHQEKLSLLLPRKIELERWSRLHELIGSNDGKKFRNFAQGLTFEIMISHANTSLRKMSDRYLLVRDPTQPLELHVIDNYQGGEIRSTKNLSGGESFIVSMALALGLSTMASHNVQVDSLFLDEGFGTLDEDSLQTALDTLAGLHHEGKIIGIISHVSGLRERIATQIRIIPGLGGISRIAGPGISGK